MEPAVATTQRLAWGSRGGRRRLQAGLGEEAVLLAGVARPARRDHVVPGVRARRATGAPRGRCSRRPVAVLAAVAVAGEDGPPRERAPGSGTAPARSGASRITDGHRQRQRARSADSRRCARRSRPSPSARARRPAASGTTQSGSKLALSSSALPKRRAPPTALDGVVRHGPDRGESTGAPASRRRLRASSRHHSR